MAAVTGPTGHYVLSVRIRARSSEGRVDLLDHLDHIARDQFFGVRVALPVAYVAFFLKLTGDMAIVAFDA